MLDVTNSFTIEDMRRFAGEAWGAFGANVVEQWCAFNAAYFDGVLRPVPVVITYTQPFGKRLAYCSYGSAAGSGRTITLNVPKTKHNGRRYQLLADNNTLLHEMVHQFLFERGEDAAHLSAGWRREIIRLTKQITGKIFGLDRQKQYGVTAASSASILRIQKPKNHRCRKK